MLFYLKKMPKFRKFAYLEGIFLTLEIVKQDKCAKYDVSSIFLRPTHYCVKQNTVPTLASNMHLFNFPLSICCGRIMHCSALYLFLLLMKMIFKKSKYQGKIFRNEMW